MKIGQLFFKLRQQGAKVTAQSPTLRPFQSPSGYVIKIQGLCSPPAPVSALLAILPSTSSCHSEFCWPWAPFALPACIPLTLPALLLPAGLPHLLLPTVDKARLAWPFTMQLLAALGCLPKAGYAALSKSQLGFLPGGGLQGGQRGKTGRRWAGGGRQREGSPFGY